MHIRESAQEEIRVTFSVRQTIADMKLEPFEFEDMDGALQELPNLKLLNTDKAQEILDVIDTDPMAAIKQLIPDIAEMPVGAVMPLVQAWLAHCEAKPGESEASSSSTKSTPRSSKRTSRASTKASTRKK